MSVFSEIIALDKPELEKTRNDLIIKINAEKIQLKNIEDHILKLLEKCNENILDHDDLITTLNEAKVTVVFTSCYK